jgi:hypothetical protein
VEAVNPESREMFDKVYDFFFGDQLRKRLVLISAFFLGQLLAIPFFGWVEPSQYIALALSISFISTWPITLLYDKVYDVRQKVNQEPVSLLWTDKNEVELFAMTVHRLTQELIRIASIEQERTVTNQTISDALADLVKRGILSQNFLTDFKKLMYDFGVISEIYRNHKSMPISKLASAMHNAEALVVRLNYTIYVNEKYVSAVTESLAEFLSRNKALLKEAGMSDEEVGRIILNMAAELRVIEEQWNRQLNAMLQSRKFNGSSSRR